MFALLGLGLVLTYRTSGVVNFAHAAIGMYVAFAYYELRASGELVLPVLGLPARVPIVDAPTTATALAAALVLAALLGLALHAVVFRPLRGAPPLARVVASLGLLLYLQQMVELRFPSRGGASFRLQSLLPRGTVEILGARVPTNRLVLAAIAIAVALVLAAVFRWTRFGLATRAAAESEKGAVLIGLAPDRLAAVNWMVASVLAGASVILISGITRALDPLATSLLVVPALAAALVGGLSSFWLTTAAGLAIGMAQSATLRWVTDAEWMPDWLPRGGLEQALPFVVILVAVTWRGEGLPTRGALAADRLPRAPRPLHPVVGTLVLTTTAAVGLVTLDAQWRLAIVVSITATLLAMSVVVLTGWVGQISLAPYAFAGVAGFTTVKLASDGGVAFPWAPLLAVAITVAAGVLVGVPAVRVRGLTLAVATLGAAVAIQELVFKSSAFFGSDGRPLAVPAPELFGVDLGFLATGSDNFRAAFGLFALAVTAVAAVAITNLRRSPTGLRWLAVRANERAAAAAGVDVTAAKLSAFGVSALLAGLGGVLLAYQTPRLAPETFVVFASLALIALTYLGGIAGLGGAVVAGLLASGGIVTRLSGGQTGETSEYQLAISGVALVAVAVLLPEGITGGIRRAARRVRSRRSGATGAGVGAEAPA